MASPAILQQQNRETFHKNTVNGIIQTRNFNISGTTATTSSLRAQRSHQTLQTQPQRVENQNVPKLATKDKPEVVGNTPKALSRAVLARKYMVVFDKNDIVPDNKSDSANNNISSSNNNNNNNTPPQLKPTEVPLKCVKLDTKEFMQCKISQRDNKGVNILAAHERLGECSEFINPISELIVTPKYFYLISPVTYGSLHSYVYSKKMLKETEARNLFKQMLAIINFCHSKGIMFKDLKMGRFVFADKERTKLKLDGLEDVVILPKPDSDDDSLDDRHGCPNYVSPEKAKSCINLEKKYSGKSTDVWCLGVSLYAMLTGRYPFNDNDCSRLIHKILEGSYTMIEGISPFAKSLIRCLLTKNPRDRPGCREILTHPWFKIYDFQSIPSRSREDSESDFCKAKRMRMNDDQVVPGS